MIWISFVQHALANGGPSSKLAGMNVMRRLRRQTVARRSSAVSKAGAFIRGAIMRVLCVYVPNPNPSGIVVPRCGLVLLLYS